MSVAVITGAGTGVGRATAIALAQRGWDIALLGHGRGVLEETAARIAEHGRDALLCVVDVADADALQAAGEQIIERFGEMHAWVNSAAVAIFGELQHMDAHDLDRVIAVSCNGVIHGSRTAAKYMRLQRQGVIVNIGSSLAFTTVPLNVPYGAAKAAVRSFSLGLGIELRKEKVVVAIAHLPAIATPWFSKVKTLTRFQSRPVGVMHDPRVVGEAIADLVERPRLGDSYLGLSTVVCVAAARLAPRLTAWVAYIGGKRLQTTKDPAPTKSNLWESVVPAPETPKSFRQAKHAPKWWPRLGRSGPKPGRTRHPR